jgi:autophagy-related protein 18
MSVYSDIRFNQDGSCLSGVTPESYTIYTPHPFNRCLAVQRSGVARVYMLYVSSLIAIVGSGHEPSLSPRKLVLYNSKTHSPICELNFKDTLLDVYLNAQRLAVVLHSRIHLFDLRSLKLLHSIDTCDNPRGVGALSSTTPTGNGYGYGAGHTAAGYGVYGSSPRSLLAYTNSNERGDFTQ